MDGSAITNLRLSGLGCLVFDSDGVLQFGFKGTVGVSNILHAEIAALMHRMDLN